MPRSAVIGNHHARPIVIGIEGNRLDSASRNAAADGISEKHDFERDVVNVARRAGQIFISFFAKNSLSYYYFTSPTSAAYVHRSQALRASDESASQGLLTSQFLSRHATAFLPLVPPDGHR